MKLQVRLPEPGKPCRARFRAITFELDYLTIEEIIQMVLFGSLADEWCRR